MHIVTDSSCDLPADLVRELKVEVVPCNVHFGDEVYRDGVDLSTKAFYQRLADGSIHPTTSQPSVGTFIETYARLAQEGGDILSVHLSSKLSATCHSARLATEEFRDGPRIEVVDSLQVSLGLGILVREVARMAQNGASLDEAGGFLKAEVPNVSSYVTVDTLQYLVRGGRASRIQGIFGGLLDIKPIITVQGDGETHPFDRVRTKKKATARFVEIVAGQKDLKGLGVLHSVSPEEAESLADACSAYIPRDQIILAELCTVLGAHLGPKALGLGLWAHN